jgi:hypothetical protein
VPAYARAMQDLTRTGGSVLIGRDDEVARVEAVLDRLRSGMGEALVISGAAGIGKSALLLHAVDLRGRFATILRDLGGGGLRSFRAGSGGRLAS